MSRVDRAWWLVLPLGACLAVGGCGDAKTSPPASAKVLRTAPDTSMPRAADLDPAELEDLRRFAKEEGVTLEDEIAHVAWNSTFSDDLEALKSDFPDTFASSGINSVKDDPGAFVEFVGTVPASAPSYFDDLPVAVVLKPNAPLSEKDATALSDLTADVIGAALSKHADFTGGYDPASHRVEYDVHDPDPHHPSADELEQMAREAYERKHSPVPVEIVVRFSDREVTDDLVG